MHGIAREEPDRRSILAVALRLTAPVTSARPPCFAGRWRSVPHAAECEIYGPGANERVGRSLFAHDGEQFHIGGLLLAGPAQCVLVGRAIVGSDQLRSSQSNATIRRIHRHDKELNRQSLRTTNSHCGRFQNTVYQVRDKQRFNRNFHRIINGQIDFTGTKHRLVVACCPMSGGAVIIAGSSVTCRLRHEPGRQRSRRRLIALRPTRLQRDQNANHNQKVPHPFRLFPLLTRTNQAA